MALYMVIEHFRNGDAAPIYRRFRERGRMAPVGLAYISSWVNEGLSTCYQIMETPDRSLLEARHNVAGSSAKSCTEGGRIVRATR
jgi:Protein of unknown function (DUF3303)